MLPLWLLLAAIFAMVAVVALVVGAGYDYRYRRRGEHLRVSERDVAEGRWAARVLLLSRVRSRGRGSSAPITRSPTPIGSDGFPLDHEG